MTYQIICILSIIVLVANLAEAKITILSNAPLRSARSSFTFEWCDCRTGTQNISIWANDKNNNPITLTSFNGGPTWLDLHAPTDKIYFTCNGMNTIQSSSKVSSPKRYWSLQVFNNKKKPIPSCSKISGRLHFVSWDINVSYNTSIVYSSGESGYACIKIPVLLRTFNNTLLAIAEARKNSCSDFAWTDLVVKSSYDHGLTWSSKLRVIRSESGPGLPHTVIGNAAPVQIKSTKRILIPHTRNNSDVWLTFSDDDGMTWSKSTKLNNVSLNEWKWIGTGPPGSIELDSGRILVPSYHSKYRGNLINNIVHGHVMISDDKGITWKLGATQFGKGDKLSNECQAVQLKNGSVLINARSFATLTTEKRIQTLSNDGGITFGPTYFIDIPQPFDGCQGSIVKVSTSNDTLYFTGPDSYVKRDHLSLWRSDDDGQTWIKEKLIDPGASGYSSLQVGNNNSLLLIYEQSDEDELIMAPDRFIFRVL